MLESNKGLTEIEHISGLHFCRELIHFFLPVSILSILGQYSLYLLYLSHYHISGLLHLPRSAHPHDMMGKHFYARI